MSSDEKIKAASDLFRRLPPSKLEDNLKFACFLLDEDSAEDLLQIIDCPLKRRVCPETGKEFLISDHNRDMDSYRSPYSNNYVPEFAEGVRPSDQLRELEVVGNELFQEYTNQYFEGGLASVYFWDNEDNSFGGAILIQKDGSGIRGCEKGVWDSIHLVDVTDNGNGTADYHLISTVILSIEMKKGKANSELDLSGYMQRETRAKDLPISSFSKHIVNIGNLLQKQENSMTEQLQSVYFDKAREITRTLRDPQSGAKNMSKALADEMRAALANRRR